jgi:hypothetical protein
MVNIRRFNPWIGCLLMASAGLVGCSPKTSVSAAGNSPAQYQHVYVSVQEIWFNTSATAGPDDTTWVKFPLSTPVTVDLATSVGALTSITTGLAVPVGTYAQIRLIPVDSGSAIIPSASSLGARFNSEVDFIDTAGGIGVRQVPLELQNPDKGIGIATSLTVKSSGNATFGTSTTGTSTTGTSTTGTSTTGTSTTGTSTTGTNTTGTSTTGTTTGTTATTTGTTATTSTTSASTTSNITYSLAINMDAAKDVVPFTYGPLPASIAAANGSVSNVVNGMLLNPHMTAYDASTTGAIAGTLNLTGLTGITSPSTNSFDYIQVTAESLSADGTRHVAVNSTPVSSSGTFTLYPLATSSTSPTSYDLVIHGPYIATIIVKGVSVNVGAPSAPVNIGTLTPRTATPFPVNVATATPLPAGALVGFYQTIPSTTGTTEVPYLIEQMPIDPFSRKFAADQLVSGATLDYETFSGSAITPTPATPVEGASTYKVAASAPLFTDGALTTTTVTSTAGLATIPALSPASGVSSTVTMQISKTSAATTTTTYNQGDLIISHDGAIVATAVLDSIMGSAASTLTITGVPGGSGTANSALYYVSVRAWNSSNPTGTLNRITYSTPFDLSSGSTASYSIQIP